MAEMSNSGLSNSNCNVDVGWTEISLTHVEYLKGDVIGYFLAWCSLLPFCICIGFITLIFFRRDLHTIIFFIGLLLNESINLMLKQVFQQQRPWRGGRNLPAGFGMPSSHSQFMWFFLTYLTMFLWMRLHRNVNFTEDLWKLFVGLAFSVAALLVSASRHYLQYHTVSQIVCGGVIGSVVGAVWFAVVHFIATPLFPHIAGSLLGELFMLRDYTLIPHILWFEYTSTRSESRSRQRKLMSRLSQ